MAAVATPYVERQVEALIAFGGLRPGMRILEVGCGMGRYTIPLARRGLAMEGLDVAQGLLERLRSQDPESSIVTHCASVEDHPRELDGSFDAVIGAFVLHHLDGLPGQFRAIREMLRPAGRVAFLEPNPYNPLYYFQITLSRNMHWWAERGIFEMRRAPLFRAMVAAGFENPGVRTFGFLPPFVINRRFGPVLEGALEAFPVWRRALPFQLYRADMASIDHA